MNEFRREEMPCARKEHRCDLCHTAIRKGKKYVRVVCSNDGYIYDNSYHTYCHDLVERYCRSRDCDDPYDDWRVLDDIAETVCEDCGMRKECNFGYWWSPLCPKVNAEYRRKK